MSAKRQREPAYALVRVDDVRALDAGEVDWRLRVTVVRVVWTMERAVAEIARLNELNADKGCIYFWQTTRCEVDDDEPDVEP